MKYLVYFDGSCGPKNPGGVAGFGAYVLSEGKRIWEINGTVKETNTSNNVAEYAALILALLYLLSIDAQDEQVIVHGDSKLVIYQMFKHWKIKNGLYKNYALACKDVVKEFSNIRGYLLPRSMNEQADALSTNWRGPRIDVLEAVAVHFDELCENEEQMSFIRNIT